VPHRGGAANRRPPGGKVSQPQGVAQLEQRLLQFT
jgi:hypothetical protein